MSLCVLAGAAAFRLAATTFTLGWTHSVEQIRWEEDWRVTPAGLEIAEARVRGSGAGMEPGPGAVLQRGWWRWRPDLGPVPDLALAASGATPSGWDLCAEGVCRTLGAEPGPPVRIAPCAEPQTTRDGRSAAAQNRPGRAWQAASPPDWRLDLGEDRGLGR